MVSVRPGMSDLRLGMGKRVRVHHLLYDRGPGNGTLQLLVPDQWLEHGPLDSGDNRERAGLSHTLQSAAGGSFSGVVLGIGPAERYFGDFAGRLPLILKLNGKTGIPPEDEALAPLNATVEDAVRLGAHAVVYTLYVGSPAQYEDFTQFSQVRQDCRSFGMPLIVMASPRWAAIERKGGPMSLYAIEYAVRVADELGADMVILDEPVPNPHKDAHAPKPYNTLQMSREDALRRVIGTAHELPMLISSSAANGEELLHAARRGMEAGAAGIVLNGGVAQHSLDAARALADQVCQILREFPA